MTITARANQTVTYDQWTERAKGFQTDSTPLVRQQLPIDIDRVPIIEMRVYELFDKFDMTVSYYQVHELDGVEQKRQIFAYQYTRDKATLDEQLTLVDGDASLEGLVDIDRLKQKLRILILADILGNNVFGLTKDDWTIN